MIEAHGLTKRYGQITAVDQLSFDVRPGVVTGFLGPNGSGKSTTMRLILGLDAADRGTVKVGGRRYRDLPCPLREVGALLEARAFHPGRSARAHLQALAASNGIPPCRVDEVLQLVGLARPHGGQPQGGPALPGHGSAARHRRRAARRPARPSPRRAGQRPGPGGHPLDQEPDEVAGRRGADRVRLQPPDHRDGADRRAPHRHRPAGCWPTPRWPNSPPATHPSKTPSSP